MTFEDIDKIVQGVPYITTRNARFLYDFIIRERLTNILELGIAHGTATCYMAAALDKLGGGKIISVDLKEAETIFKPSPEEQLAKAHLQHLVQIVRMQTGYSWFLHDEIKRLTANGSCKTEYDLCVIDGPKNWTIDGSAFFMVDKILKENGWIIFDDYLWTYQRANKRKTVTDGISHRSLSIQELKTPHIKEVFELLVMQHPGYSEFFVHPDDDWAMAHKKISEQRTCKIEFTETNRDILVQIKGYIKKLLGYSS